MHEGDEIAFSDFMAARWNALFRTAYLITGDRHQAEDLLQAALAKTFIAWKRVKAKEAADAYVRRVMINTAASRWKRGRRESVVAVLPDRGHDGGMESATTQVVLWERICALPPRMRATLVLRYYEDLTEAETARELGCSLGAVKSQTHHALKRLRDSFGEMDEDVRHGRHHQGEQMNDLTTQVRETLTGEAHEVQPPPIDHVGFDAAVRAARRRRRGSIAAVGAVAALTLVVGYGLSSGSDSSAPLTPATGSTSGSIHHPAILLAGPGEVGSIAEDDSGYGKVSIDVAHVEEVFRAYDGLLLIGDDSRLLHVAVSGDSNAFGRAQPVTEEAILSVVVSKDGRTAAWTTLDGSVEVYDLVRDEQMRRFNVGRQAQLFGIDGSDVLLRDPGHDGWGQGVYLDTGEGASTYLVGPSDGSVTSADISRTTISLTSGNTTVFFDRTHGQPAEATPPVEASEGHLSPDGAHYLGLSTIETADGLAPPVAVWDTQTGSRLDFTDLPRPSWTATWLDSRSIAITGRDVADGGDLNAGTNDIYACELASMRCGFVRKNFFKGEPQLPNAMRAMF